MFGLGRRSARALGLWRRRVAELADLGLEVGDGWRVAVGGAAPGPELLSEADTGSALTHVRDIRPKFPQDYGDP